MKTAEEMLELAMPSVIEGMKKELTQSITWDVKNTASKLIVDHVSEWVKENILPDISTQLAENKDSLIAVGIQMGPLMVQALSEAMLVDLKKNLESSWDRQKIYKALFE